MSKFLKSAGLVALVSFSMSAEAAQTTTDKDGCVINIQKEGGETLRVCKDGLTIGGPIKDVTLQTPLGRENAAIPKAGRDIERAVHDVGKFFGL